MIQIKIIHFLIKYRRVNKIQYKSLLEKVEILKKKAIAESYESKMKPMTSRQYKSLLDQAEEDYKNGRVTSQEDLKKEPENW